jgi:uncharacterized protein with PQ loop repeat
VAGIALVAGSVATAIFMLSQLPMLIKAGRTKDLASYSPLNIVLSNVGNLIYAVYVFNLPAGPIWAMHVFYLTATGLMLFWYLRHARADEVHVVGGVLEDHAFPRSRTVGSASTEMLADGGDSGYECWTTTVGEDHASFATGPAAGLADLHDPCRWDGKRSVAGGLAVRAPAG